MVTGTCLAGLTLPAGSVSVTVKFCGPPLPKGVVGVTDHLPSVPTVVASDSPVGEITVIVSPGTPVPMMLGVVSLVTLSPATPLSDAGSSMALATGAVLSIVTGTVVIGPLLPAGSVSLIVKFCGPPAGNAVVGVTDQVPSDLTTAVNTSPVGLVTVMVSPGAAPLPLMVGLSSLVSPSPLVPESDVGSSIAVGLPGALVSMVTGTVVGALTLPAGSVAVTLNVCGALPGVSGVVGVRAHLPSLPTVVVNTSPVGLVTVILSPGFPMPLIVGVVSAVTLSPFSPVSELGSKTAAGAAGLVVSMVTGTFVAALALPAGSVAVTTKFWGPPSSNGTDGVTLHLPSEATVAVSFSPFGVTTVMVSPGVPVPLMVGVVSDVK